MMDEVFSFGQWLQRRRKAVDLTQADLGQRVGVATDTIRKIEADARRPSHDVAERLAAQLGVAADEWPAFVRFARGESSAHVPRLLPADTDAAPWRPPVRPASHLPRPMTELIGRERETLQVVSLITRTNVRLVTLTGPGGIGKTRLALQVAAEVVDQFPDGVWFVDLSPVVDATFIPVVIAQRLGIPETAGTPLAITLAAALRDKTVLILLDNFEHVLSAAPAVSDLLSAAPRLKVLVTSRAVLGLYGEQDVFVPPLALPDPAEGHAPEQLLQYDAVRLFIERAHAVNAEFLTTTDSVLTVAEICARLDGLPLAIELAAARVSALPPAALLKRLDHRLDLLTSGRRDRPVRQQTLRDAIAWSYSLLSSDEQRLFARLAVFSGSASLEAIEAICGATGTSAVHVLDAVSSLVDNSLVRHGVGPADEPRFSMLETIHEYAREQLTSSGQLRRLQQVHGAYFRAFAATAVREFTGPRIRAWLQRLEVERDNLRAALRATFEHGAVDDAVQLVGSLVAYWVIRDYQAEGHQWVERALERTGETGRETRATILCEAGHFAWADVPRARHLLEASVALWREIGPSAGLARALCRLGATLEQAGDVARADVYLHESLAVAREVDQPMHVVSALYGLAHLAEHRGDHTQMTQYAEESLGIARRHEIVLVLPALLTLLGFGALRQGALARARMLAEESLHYARELGLRNVLPDILTLLADTAAQQGDGMAAEQYSAENLALCRETGNTRGYAAELNMSGWRMVLRGNPTTAIPVLEEALAVARHVQSARLTAAILHTLGVALVVTGDVRNAQRFLLEGIAMASESGNTQLIREYLAALSGAEGVLATIDMGMDGHAWRSAVLGGAAAAVTIALGVVVAVAEQALYDRLRAPGHAQLDEATWEAGWSAGHALSLEQAVAYALNEGSVRMR